ncbi:DUF1800 domain-containing protein [soil metagenome]
MAVSNQQKNQHLLWRAAFGPAISDVQNLKESAPKKIFEKLVSSSATQPAAISVVSNYMQQLYEQMGGNINPQNLTKEQKQMIREQSRSGLKTLNLSWLNIIINTDAQFREKMSFFWHGHFACRIVNVFYQQQLLDIIRKNALNDFGTLLKQVSKSAAMLSFLNNQQNKKQHPNENFAREVMELFTMGRGNYKETDIKEAARAFTGWGFNIKGDFVERPFQHDNGNKTFLGRTGNFTGDDILEILLEQKQTAKFITEKIYKFYVNETPDPVQVKALADSFYTSGYNIKGLLEKLFTSDHFFSEKNIGTRIKSPIELIAGIRRILPMTIQKEEAQLLMQRVLGQTLFFPPNVAGWPGGKNWIDSSSLMVRLRLPQVLTNADELSVKPKTDDDTAMGQDAQNGLPGKFQQVNAVVDWNKVMNSFTAVDRNNLSAAISNLLLQSRSNISKNIFENYADKSSREEYIKSGIIHIMSTPEYQLC